jgi:hypothetical protein
MSVDVRTRSDGPVEPVDPGRFFTVDLPAALDAAAGRLGPALAFLDLAPLTVDVDGGRWTLDAADGRVTVRPGTPGGQALRIDAEQLTDLVHDQVTPMGWLTGGRLHLGGGRLEPVLSWWLVLRAVLDGRTPHVPGAVELRDADGAPLDLGRSFAADEPPEEMAAFLAEAGFLHITGLFTDDEMAAVSADMDRAAPGYERGDGRSWWATLRDGSARVVRMQQFDRESATTAALVADDRFLRLGSLTGDDHRWGKRSANRIEALFKPIGVNEGISDVPWHKDCSLGRHSYECCSLTVGISVTGADAASGQLSVVAGSHRALVWPAPKLQPGLDLPVVDLPTHTGDVTIHLSCTLHMAHPPIERERRVMYSGFSLPAPDPAQYQAGRARLGQIREAAPVTVSQ